MEMRFTTAFILLIAVLCSCGDSRVQRLADGIVVRPRATNAQVKLLRLQVITDNIIRVTATAADTFSTRESLMVVPDLRAVGSWALKDSPDQLSIITPTLRAEVSRETGAVSFFDSAGNVLLKEPVTGGKTLTATTVEGQPSYRIRQVFESPRDEAFFGLGGHQNGQMNYKGDDVELIQHNIVDVVPFFYSSKNYGVLWDNYSISRFGDPRPYEPLSSLQLFSENGQPGGLSASYYVGDRVVKTAVENEIAFEFLETPAVENFPKEVSRHGRVVWEGTFTSETEGEHKFLVYASGYYKVWIDDHLVVDRWRQNWNPWTDKFTRNVRRGERHAIRIEWTPDDGGYMAVKHLDPLPQEEQNQLSLSSEVGDEIDYYFVNGQNADAVISGYRYLTGKAPVVPKWAMGFWQSRERYTSQKELLDVVKEYRDRQIPLDNIVLDWQYWEDPKWGSHEFDATRFPDPGGMVNAIHDRYHANMMISVWPKFNKGTKHYEEMKKHGFLFTRNIEKQRKDWVGVGYESTFYDPFNQEAGAMFWDQIDTKLNRLGIDAWWLDATEPDMHSNLSLEERKRNMSPTALGPGARYFNAYSLANSKSVYEGQRKSSPDKRVFILTRSAYAGQQRYGAATWSGDVASRWTDFGIQIAAGINFSLSGVPYWTMDIGGFSVERRYYDPDPQTLEEWRELNTRWFQFGAFCPIFRSHGQYPYREIYNISPEGHPAYNSMLYYTRLRYRLMPYIYSLAGHTYFDDYTLMRGLVMDFPEDTVARSVADQYMFGPALLINPVHRHKARSREVYLPGAAGWYDLYSGEHFEGGQVITASAPFERMPVFVREGSILPAGPELQYAMQRLADPLTLYVFTGADGTFSLYEDEGTNYDYEQGKYALIPFTYSEKDGVLNIGERQGSFPGMLRDRAIEVVWVSPDRPAGVTFSATPDEVVQYNGAPITLTRK